MNNTIHPLFPVGSFTQHNFWFWAGAEHAARTLSLTSSRSMNHYNLDGASTTTLAMLAGSLQSALPPKDAVEWMRGIIHEYNLWRNRVRIANQFRIEELQATL